MKVILIWVGVVAFVVAWAWVEEWLWRRRQRKLYPPDGTGTHYQVKMPTNDPGES